MFIAALASAARCSAFASPGEGRVVHVRMMLSLLQMINETSSGLCWSNDSGASALVTISLTRRGGASLIRGITWLIGLVFHDRCCLQGADLASAKIVT